MVSWLFIYDEAINVLLGPSPITGLFLLKSEIRMAGLAFFFAYRFRTTRELNICADFDTDHPGWGGERLTFITPTCRPRGAAVGSVPCQKVPRPSTPQRRHVSLAVHLCVSGELMWRTRVTEAEVGGGLM